MNNKTGEILFGIGWILAIVSFIILFLPAYSVIFLFLLPAGIVIITISIKGMQNKKPGIISISLLIIFSIILIILAFFNGCIGTGCGMPSYVEPQMLMTIGCSELNENCQQNPADIILEKSDGSQTTLLEVCNILFPDNMAMCKEHCGCP
ncbi:MAG: hypothetical protein ABIA21_03835 [Candidatus Aenigmatarchaeota archaeon]